MKGQERNSGVHNEVWGCVLAHVFPFAFSLWNRGGPKECTFVIVRKKKTSVTT